MLKITSANKTPSPSGVKAKYVMKSDAAKKKTQIKTQIKKHRI